MVLASGGTWMAETGLISADRFDEVTRINQEAVELRKFQNLNHPKNRKYDGEINETWDNYFSGTA
jgi:hypothetical protein